MWMKIRIARSRKNYLMDSIDTIDENLQVTMEEPDKNNSLIFLDMVIRPHQDGNLSSERYRKERHF